MRTEIFLLGIDYIFSDGVFKVLEVQALDESEYELAKGLTSFDPVTRLLKVLPRQLLKDRKFSPPCSQVEGNLFDNSLQNGIFFNRNIEVFCQQKWLFYVFCNQNPSLSHYIPQTIITTVPTFDAQAVKPMGQVLFKPPSLAKGRGIVKIDPANAQISQRLFELRAQHVSPTNTHNPFVLQQYLCDEKNNSLPVCRVYVAVTIEIENGNPKKITPYIDVKSVTTHKRREQKNDDFTVENNTSEVHVVSTGEQELIRTFLIDFCRQVFIGEKRVSTYQCWIGFAKQYVRRCQPSHLGEPRAVKQRLALVSQLLAALGSERCYQTDIFLHEVMLILFLINYIDDKDPDLKQKIDTNLWHYFAGSMYVFAARGSAICKSSIIKQSLFILVGQCIKLFSECIQLFSDCDGDKREGYQSIQEAFQYLHSELGKGLTLPNLEERYCVRKLSATDQLIFSYLNNGELAAFGETNFRHHMNTSHYACLKR